MSRLTEFPSTVREATGLPVSCVHDGATLFDEEGLREALLQRICGHY
jgi:hypothetical protein